MSETVDFIGSKISALAKDINVLELKRMEY